MRKEHHRALDHGARAQGERTHLGRPRAPRRPRPYALRRDADGDRSRRRDLDDLPGADDLTQSRAAVMYAGDIIETAEVGTLFEHPTHPYTEALLSSIPRVDRDASDLKPIAGQVPPITSMPSGCRYADRCPLRVARCATMPPLVALADDPDHQVRCWVRAGDGGLTT